MLIGSPATRNVCSPRLAYRPLQAPALRNASAGGRLRREAVVDFVQGMYTTSLAQGEIVLGFEIPCLRAGARWGAPKVTRKSSAFAPSIAFVVEHDDMPARVILGATSSRAQSLPTVAGYLSPRAPIDEAELRVAIDADLDSVDPEAYAYQRRAHTATHSWITSYTNYFSERLASTSFRRRRPIQIPQMPSAHAGRHGTCVLNL
jgi:hypothetical protein